MIKDYIAVIKFGDSGTEECELGAGNLAEAREMAKQIKYETENDPDDPNPPKCEVIEVREK